MGEPAGTDRTVATRDTAYQLSVFVVQSQRHAIELQLADVFDVLPPSELVYAALPTAQLFFAVCIVERKHWLRMHDLREFFRRLAANAMRRTVGTDQSRKALLDGVVAPRLVDLVAEHHVFPVGFDPDLRSELPVDRLLALWPSSLTGRLRPMRWDSPQRST